MFVSITEYARHRGCNLKAVQVAVSTGRIKREADGTIDVEKADRDWEKNTEHAKARYGPKSTHHVEGGRKASSTWAAKKRAEADGLALADPQRSQTTALSFANARAAKEVYEARLKKLEFEERQGALVPKRAVDVNVFNLFRVLRDACLNVPSRLAAQLAAEPDPLVLHDLLYGELQMVFEEFSAGKMNIGGKAE